MHVQIESPQIAVSAALKEFIGSKLRNELAFCGHRIRKVHAHLSDINGKRGGSDKRCRLVVRLNQASEIVVESTEADLYCAITRSADRMRRTVARTVAKKTRFRHLQVQPMIIEHQTAPAA